MVHKESLYGKNRSSCYNADFPVFIKSSAHKILMGIRHLGLILRKMVSGREVGFFKLSKTRDPKHERN
jgi:hypothetical protein